MLFPTMNTRQKKNVLQKRQQKDTQKILQKKYCYGEGLGCIEKEYVENCEVGLKCCFATIEEDKKWNYLDYDEIGNKIEK